MCQYFQLALWFLTVFRLRKWYEWQLCTPRVVLGRWMAVAPSSAKQSESSKKSTKRQARPAVDQHVSMTRFPPLEWSHLQCFPAAGPQGSSRFHVANVASHVQAPERAFHLCSFMLFHSYMRHVFFWSSLYLHTWPYITYTVYQFTDVFPPRIIYDWRLICILSTEVRVLS